MRDATSTAATWLTMCTGISIMVKPWWLRMFIERDTWVTLGTTIYHPDGVDLERSAPIILHEAIHATQQRKYGVVRWLWRYITDRSFRLAQEVEGIATEIIFSDRAARQGLIEFYARALSGRMYRRAATTYTEAVEAILRDIDREV